jgi:predicted DNA-binding protein with PD1-like motif
VEAIALRLHPQADLRQSLWQWVIDQSISAAYVATCVGSLSQATLRFAGQSEATVMVQPFEIIALVGTLAQSGVHLHVGLAGATGQCVGGHVLQGCLVRTTAELVLGIVPYTEFRRVLDPETGYPEMEIRTLL